VEFSTSVEQYSSSVVEKYIMQIVNFFKEVKAELDKIVWPTREQTIRYSILVIIVAVASGAFLGGLDYVLTLATDFLIKNYAR